MFEKPQKTVPNQKESQEFQPHEKKKAPPMLQAEGLEKSKMSETFPTTLFKESYLSEMVESKSALQTWLSATQRKTKTQLFPKV